MPSLCASELLPIGFCAVGALSEGDSAVITIRARRVNSPCPSCGAVSDRVHSRYPRRLADLPIAGRLVVLMLQARRFRCEAVLCRQRIFTERFDDSILKPWARRTARLDQIVHCLALALGGRPAASFARRLSIPVSNDTLLRTVRKRGSPSFAPPAIIGIDDWAWRRNHRYGTLICDLERRKTIALLPDREPATAEAWLTGQTQIAVVARDRGGSYALATQKALPNAMQVADRWHLMENASHAFLDAVRRSMRQIRTVIGATTINPALLTAAEKLQHEGYVRREETNAAILAMAKEGATIKEIVRSAGYSRGLVRKVLRGQRSDIFRVRSSSLETYLPWLDEQWAAGCRNGSELWRSLKRQGFRGCLRVVSEWSGRRRRSEKMDASAISRAPSARTIARLMTIGRDRLSKAETVTVAAIESGVELLLEAREVVADFQAMIRGKALSELDPWIERAKTSLVAAFANGVTKDKAAVSAAISSGWSNGQAEGQICKLKLVKRQMYGRGKLDLLQARVIGAT
jgi:transposase